MNQTPVSLTADESTQLGHYLNLIDKLKVLATAYHEVEDVKQFHPKFRRYAEYCFTVACKASEVEVKKMAITQSNCLAQILALLYLFCRIYDQVKQTEMHPRNYEMCEKKLQSFYHDEVKPVLRYAEKIIDQPYDLLHANGVALLENKFRNFNSEWKNMIEEFESEKLKLMNRRTKALFYGITSAGAGIVILAAWCFDRPVDTSKSMIYLTATILSFATGAASLIYKDTALERQEKQVGSLLDVIYKYQGDTNRMVTNLDLFSMDFIWKT